MGKNDDGDRSFVDNATRWFAANPIDATKADDYTDENGVRTETYRDGRVYVDGQLQS